MPKSSLVPLSSYSIDLKSRQKEKWQRKSWWKTFLNLQSDAKFWLWFSNFIQSIFSQTNQTSFWSTFMLVINLEYIEWIRSLFMFRHTNKSSALFPSILTTCMNNDFSRHGERRIQKDNFQNDGIFYFNWINQPSLLSFIQ